MEIKDFSYTYNSILQFDMRFTDFKSFDKKFCNGKLREDDKIPFLNTIETVVSYYYRYIKRYAQKEKGLRLIELTKVFKYGAEEGIINDADTWLEYIEDSNVYYNTSNPEKKAEIADKMINYYHDKVYSMYENVHTPEHNELMKEYAQTQNALEKAPLNLADNNPVYSPEELDITDRAYKILIEFIKKKPYIKNVWLHGSRIHRDYNRFSDIDLIVDCKAMHFNNFIKGLRNLPIQYYVDAVCLDIPWDLGFVKRVSATGTKKIYCSDDFKLYWANDFVNPSKPKIDISKIVNRI